MKKTISLVISAILLITVILVFPATAADMSEAVGAVNVGFGKPVADGKINEGEYTAHVTISDKNMKAVTSISYNVPATHSIELYFSWDNDYLYAAYGVTDPTPAPSAVNEDGNWLFNGDNIQFFADFGPTLAYRELNDTATFGGRRSSLFAAGMNSDDTYFLLHQLSQNDAILNLSPDAPPSSGKKTEKGWVFEYAISWDMLMKDMTDKTGVALSADNVGNGTKINCMVIYNDYETAGVLKNMFGTTSTGYEDPFDWQPEVFGINLTLTGGDKSAETVLPPEGAPVDSGTDSQSEDNSDSTELPDTVVTTTEDKTTQSGTSAGTGENDGGDRNKTIIIAVSAAVAAAVTAAVIIIVVRRKKK